MRFEFRTPGQILFGRGQFDAAGALVDGLGSRAFVVRGGKHLDESGAIARLSRQLLEHRIDHSFHTLQGEPDVAAIDGAVHAARELGADVVVGLGGGSVVDAAKAVAALLTHDGEALDFLEVVGRGKRLSHASAPMLAMPTTAGTGSEVTRNAVILVRDKGFKASMRSEHMIPRVALVDPWLTDAMPPAVTASTGLDALTQLIEPYVSTGATPLTDGLALEGLRLMRRSLRTAYMHPKDTAARDDMALAALMGGMCLAHAGLGAVHGIAAPLGAALPIAHGVACAALLPHVIRANIRALRRQAPYHPALHRYADVAAALLGHRMAADDSMVDAAVEYIAQLATELGVPKLSTLGLSSDQLVVLAERAQKASSMKYNPVELTRDELIWCLAQAC